MSVVGTADAPLEIFGGLVTDMSPADLPAGVSFDCADVKFLPGSVQTRPGLLSIFPAISGNPTVNYLKTYVPPTGLLRLLALDAAGSLWKESSVGVLSLISSSVVPASFGKSASLFTREYLAIGDGKFGIDIPRQFDDTNFDRVSQVGPGTPPSATDETAAYSIVSSPAGASMTSNASSVSASQVGNLATYVAGTLINGDLWQAGDQISVSGITPAGYNGTITLVTPPGPTGTSFTAYLSTSGLGPSTVSGGAQSSIALINATAPLVLAAGSTITTSSIGVAGYNGTWKTRQHATDVQPVSAIYAVITGSFGLANSGGGSFTVAGNISAGLHQITVAFITRQGAIFICPLSNSWTAAGSKRVNVSNIPIGPSNIVGRILIFTAAAQSFFFYSSGITGIAGSNMIIRDNTTTSTTVDFTDVGLAASISADNLFNLLELGECSWVIDYSSRLFWGGERNKVQNFNNLSFDGGHGAVAGGGNAPLGWTPDSSNFHAAGGFSTNPAVWGEAYQITGDGATSIVGMITQTAYQDTNNVAIIQPNTAYSARIKLTKQGTVTQGNFVVELLSNSAGSLGTFSTAITAVPSGGVFQEFIGPLMASRVTIPTDTVLRVYTGGTFSAATVIADNLEIYPTNQPFNSSLVRASKVEGPESYDGVTGFMLVNENDGFAVRSAFVIRENLYFVKEHGIYETQADPQNEPSNWKITEISRKVGTPSVNGVAVAQDWAVIVHRTGLYFFAGGEPRKISQEIQPTWDTINWAAAQTIWTQIDMQNRRVYVGVPLNGATKPNTVLMMDYRGIDPPDEIPTANPIHTSYSGKLLVLEKSRKWSIWNIVANSGAIVERFDGTQQMFLGNGAGTGKIYQLSDTQFTDDGATIAGYYNTYFHFTHDLEQAFQLGSHNKLYTYMRLFAEGSGTLVLSAIPPGNSTVRNLPPIQITAITLNNPAFQDLEFPINVTASRAAFKITTANNGNWFRVARFIVNAIKHPTAPVRGWN